LIWVWGLGMGGGGLGIGDWAQSPIPNPQSPIPNPQSPFKFILIRIIKLIFFIVNYKSKLNLIIDKIKIIF